MSNVIEKLQALDESKKRTVLIGATVVIMLVVVYFWLAYFNNLIASVESSTDLATTQPDVQATDTATGTAPVAVVTTQPTVTVGSSGGIFQGAKNSLAFIGEAFAGFFRAIGGIFRGQGQYVVQPNGQ